MVVSVFILVNTLKATMYNRRREIYIMKMIGATDSFVQLPFFVEGVVLGVISALIAYLVIRLGYVGMADYLEAIGVNAITWPELRLWVLLSFLGVGFAVGLFSSSVSIKKYLKV